MIKKFLAKRQLFKFLKKEGVLKSYLANAEILPTLSDIRPKTLYITGAFTWKYSSEGHTFWQNLNKKWCYYLDKKYKY